jgi:hypothetical protein
MNLVPPHPMQLKRQGLIQEEQKAETKPRYDRILHSQIQLNGNPPLNAAFTNEERLYLLKEMTGIK